MEPSKEEPFTFDSPPNAQQNTDQPKQTSNDAMFDAFNEINQKQDEVPVDLNQAKDEPQSKAEEEEFKFANTNVPKKVVQPQEVQSYEYVYM